jgi:hypothetical protein
VSPTTDRIRSSSLLRVLLGAVAGVLIAVLVGLAAVAMAPDNGFGDLAAAAVTLVFGIPAGAILGGVAGFLIGRRKADSGV